MHRISAEYFLTNMCVYNIIEHITVSHDNVLNYRRFEERNNVKMNGFMRNMQWL